MFFSLYKRMHAHNVVGLITLALLLEVVARRALAVTVVVAPPAQLVAPSSRAPNLTRPGGGGGSAPDNMRICVKYACKNLKYSLIEKS